MDNRPIGVFDSGLGGLTVVKELMRQLPNESIIYFGDTARIPYGTRSPETVTRYSEQCARFLMSMNIKLIVIACNTASSTSLGALRELFDVPVVGVIDPGASAAVQATRNGRVGVIGTPGTIRSRAYFRAISEKNESITVCNMPCALFVPIVEEGWSDTDIARLTAARYLKPMKKEGIDTLVLGCTHYPLLMNSIGEVMGSGVTLVNPAVGTAEEVKNILKSRDMFRETPKNPEYKYFVSGFGQKFQEIASAFLGHKIGLVEKTDIEKY